VARPAVDSATRRPTDTTATRRGRPNQSVRYLPVGPVASIRDNPIRELTLRALEVTVLASSSQTVTDRTVECVLPSLG